SAERVIALSISPLIDGTLVLAKDRLPNWGATEKVLYPGSNGLMPQASLDMIVSPPPLQAWFTVPPPYPSLPIPQPSNRVVKLGLLTISAKRFLWRALAKTGCLILYIASNTYFSI